MMSSYDRQIYVVAERRMAMNIRYTLSLNDMLAFQSYCNAHIPQAKQAQFRTRIIFPLIAVAFSLILTVNNPQFFVTGLCIIGLAFLFALLFPLLSTYLFIRHFQKAHRGNTSEEFTFNLDEQGISSGSSKGKTDIFWNTVKNIVVTDTLILFFYTPICAIVVPKSAIGNQEAYDNFAQLVQRYHRQPNMQV